MFIQYLINYLITLTNTDPTYPPPPKNKRKKYCIQIDDKSACAFKHTFEKPIAGRPKSMSFCCSVISSQNELVVFFFHQNLKYLQLPFFQVGDNITGLDIYPGAEARC